MAERSPGLSIRVKLTLSYAGFLLVAAVALFAVGFLILRFVPTGALQQINGGAAPNRGDLLEVFVRYAWWALGALLVFGLVGGWLLAGRMLRPLAQITDAARRASDGALGHRIRLPGRRDELTDLADAFDDMLARVEGVFAEQGGAATDGGGSAGQLRHRTGDAGGPPGARVFDLGEHLPRREVGAGEDRFRVEDRSEGCRRGGR